jgi:hypothetical protein
MGVKATFLSVASALVLLASKNYYLEAQKTISVLSRPDTK